MGNHKTQMINGVKYVYQDKPVWDANKKYGTHKRDYIGKMVDGQFVPNKKYQLQMQIVYAAFQRLGATGFACPEAAGYNCRW